MNAEFQQKRGRPKKNAGEKYVRVLITLPPAIDELARKIGDGDRSKGIRLALQYFHDACASLSGRGLR